MSINTIIQIYQSDKNNNDMIIYLILHTVFIALDEQIIGAYTP